ncbi:glycosyltransferase family 2 protein [Cellulomonas sp. ICMP 17802]|uniref:glycosyltransferase family 2 protein n=1 Tax=Cellulomonas sp. ICMP 17802 TaxID=3239199 RepID=UPI00351BAB71
MSPSSLNVVVVAFNSAQVLPGLLASLPDGLAGLDWHLVVVDNASSDDSVDVVRRLAPDATVVATGRNGGYAAGVNAGVAAGPPCEAVLVLNPDVRLDPECAPRLLRALRSSGAGLAVPRLRDARGELIPSMRREPSLVRAAADALIGAERAGRIGTLGEVITDAGRYEADTWTDWAEGSTLLVSHECLTACGPWDETFFLYSEETEFALRARDRGFRTRYVAVAGAVHLEGDSAASPRLWPLVVANRLVLFRRRHGPVATSAFWVLLVIREGSRALLGRDTSRAALRGLFRPRWLWSPKGPQALVWSAPA